MRMTEATPTPNPTPAEQGAERGAGIVEYVLLVLAIALGVLAAMALLGNTLSDAFGDIANGISEA